MQAIINGEMYEVEPAVKVIIDKLMIENAELKKENARFEEGYQKSLGVIAATDCEECKNKVYRKAYNDVMKIRANIQEIIEDVSKKGRRCTMRVHDKELFDSHCPYTDELCDSWECDTCEVEQTEQQMLKEFYKDGESE